MDKHRKSATREAKNRFLADFQARFVGISKKAIWEKLFKGANYPALATFYSHIQSNGSVEAYLEKHFLRKLEDYFPAMFADYIIESLLARAHSEMQKAEQAARDWSDYLPSDE